MNKKFITILIVALIGASSAFAHSKAIKPEYVDMLLTPYFELQTALAKDDLATAKSSAGTFNKMLGHGPSHEDAPSLADLTEEAAKIQSASDIKIAREAFHAISKDLAKMVEHVGTSGKSDVVKMHCPMAFNNKGGAWLQNSEDLANPYYGAMMLKCGSVKETLASAKGGHGHMDHGKMKKKEGSHGHSGHSH